MKNCINMPKAVRSVIDNLRSAKYEAYVVGGCVRDTLLGFEPHDWDITTSATPVQVKEVFSEFKQIDTGLKHGTVTIVVDGSPLEITTFRTDGKYTDGRHPDNVTFTTSIVDDLSRRDYTINSCAMNETSIVDPFGGQQDIECRIIRCVGDPYERFQEDALRILRGIRFASVLGFDVDQNTKDAINNCRQLLDNVSAERITSEFCKILNGKNTAKVLYDFRYVIAYIIPEVLKTIGFDQHNRYHIYDVYNHIIQAVNAAPTDKVIRVALFFHDIGKPLCYSYGSNKQGHFYGHADLSAKMATIILKRMKFPTADINDIVELIQLHDIQIAPSEKTVKRLLANYGEKQLKRLIIVKRCDILAQNPDLLKGRIDELNKASHILDTVIENEDCVTLKSLAVNGNDLLNLGFKKGPEIGIVLKKLLKLVIDGDIQNEHTALVSKAVNCHNSLKQVIKG